MDISEITGEKNGKTLVVKFWFGKLGVKQYHMIMDTIKDTSSDIILVTTKNWITPYARNLILQNVGEFNIEMFEMTELVYNITHHFLQPKVEQITDPVKIEEVNHAFVQNNDATKHKNLRETDPLIKYYNGKPGDMFKIIMDGGRVHYTVITS
jgi:DNA-directed RNA polymerase subunit H (RpoH/RPB5)